MITPRGPLESCVVGASGDEHVHGTEPLVVARVLAQYQRHESRARKASPFVFGACTCADTVYCRGSPGLNTTPKNEGIKQAQAVACASLEYCTTLPLRPKCNAHMCNCACQNRKFRNDGAASQHHGRQLRHKALQRDWGVMKFDFTTSPVKQSQFTDLEVKYALKTNNSQMSFAQAGGRSNGY